MANSDKNILITPNTGSTTLNPTIVFTGANNTPLTLRTFDTGTLSFEGTAGQLFSISDGLTGSIFSVNDISGIPSVEVLDTGLIKLNQYNGQIVIGSSAAITVSSVPAMISTFTRSATTPGLIIRGFTSQSANLTEWQNSGGGISAAILSSGYLLAAGIIDVASNGAFLATAPGGPLTANTRTSTITGLVVKGVASQSADLQQWQNSSSTVLSAIDTAGNFTKGDGDQLLLAGQIF